MSILFDTTGHGFVFALYGCHIAHTCHLARNGVGEDYLVGNLLLRVFLSLNVDGYLLVIVAYRAAHGGDALSLQSREEHLLADAVGLQALAIDVETDLLLLFAEEFYISYTWDAAQAIGEVVAILLEFAIAALVALDSDEQSRGIAEVIVDHDGQHTAGQLGLKPVESVLYLRPDLVLIIHIVVEFNHHDTHAVLRLRGGLLTIYLAIGEEVALKRTSHLLFDLLAGGTRIYSHYHTLTDGGVRKLILRHDIHAVDAHHKQYADDEQCYRVMLQRPSEPICILHISKPLWCFH